MQYRNYTVIKQAINGYLTSQKILYFSESRAIIRYYAAKYEDKGTKLTGKTLEEKAVVDQWLEVESNNFNDLVYNMVLQLVVFPKMGQNSDLTLVHKCADKLEKVFDIYEQRLSKTKYLAGDFFSLADLSHLPSLRFLMNEGGFANLVRKRKCLNDWFQAGQLGTKCWS